MHPADITKGALLNRLMHKDKILHTATADKLETKEGRKEGIHYTKGKWGKKW